jgi:rhodanese-related sulfurtransferase
MKHHSPQFLALVRSATQHIKEITAQTLAIQLTTSKPLVLIDVREHQEWIDGAIKYAIHLSKGIIERDIEKIIPQATSIVVYCSGGFRSALVADNLQKMGYTDVYSLAKGLTGWIELGYPITNCTKQR